MSSPGPNGPGKANSLEAPHAEGAAVGDHFLVVAVGAFTGTATPIEMLPNRCPAMDWPNEAGMVVARHAVTRAPDAVAVRALLLFLGRTLPAADLLPTLGGSS